ncbi:MAG: class I SAM-dependent methyltransferase [Chloroflexi bacterium]|nr:class I SAM-dependent methyltransferase [Chloroflexota bacterium]
MEFDRLARNYDSEFTERPIARILRARTHERTAAQLALGMRALDIGCGTGIDAAWMAERGAAVTAVDGSAAMLEVARSRVGERGSVTFAQVDLNALIPLVAPGPYDIALANFGALNAASDLGVVAAWLAERVRPGGWVGMAVMSRFCAWETLWQAVHLRPRAAARRWGGRAVFGSMTVFYPSQRVLVRAMAPAFRLERRAGLGVFLPPSEMFGVVEARPRLFERLLRWDDAAWRRGRFAWAADHLWLEFRRT